jgi:hypothetical protein
MSHKTQPTFARQLGLIAALLILAGVNGLPALAQEIVVPRPIAPRVRVAPPLRGDYDDDDGERKPVKADSVLRGRVIYDDTQRPVSRAQIKIQAIEPPQAPILAVAGRNGEFEAKGLREGQYVVSAAAPGALSLEVTEALAAADKEETAAKPEEEAPPWPSVSVKLNGADAKDVTVHMARGGAIAGRILYDDGEPVTFARLTLFRRMKTGLMPFATSETRTDDRGRYRLEEVPSGEYAVGVVDTISAELGKGVVTVYHPAATNAQDASMVSVTSAGETENVNLTVPTKGLRKASGVVKWKKTGQPLAQASVVLRRRDEKHLNRPLAEIYDSLAAGQKENIQRYLLLTSIIGRDTENDNGFPTKTDEEGRWQAADLPAGEYVIEVTARPPTEDAPPANIRQEDDPFAAMGAYATSPIKHTQELSLRDSDAEDVAVDVTEGGVIAGVILDSNGAPPASPMSIMAFSHTDGKADSSNHEMVSAVSRRDGTFRLRGVTPGQVRLTFRFMVGNEGPRYVRSINYGGADIANQTLTLTPNTEINGLQVRLGNEFGAIEGRVLKANGKPAARARVLIITSRVIDGNAGENEIGPDNGNSAFELTDNNGAFKASVRPGEYLLVAEPDFRQGFPETLRQARRVTVTIGQPATVELTLKPPPAPKP